MLKIGQMNVLELDVVHCCNMRCVNCERICGLAPEPITKCFPVDELRKHVGEWISLKWPWKEIHVCGGEPSLHPDIEKIIGLLETYQMSHNKGCKVIIFSNGVEDNFGPLKDSAGGKICLAKHPSIEINFSLKSDFGRKRALMTVSPIELGVYDPADNRCLLPSCCGISLNRNGYFPCAPGGAIDRVRSLGLGLKSLSEVTKRRLISMACNDLCGHCGQYLCARLGGNNFSIDFEPKTEGWVKQIDSYNRRLESEK